MNAGADYGDTINHFAGQISTLVDEAIKYGGTLPTALQPIAQALVDAGELTDSTGAKITDLSKLHFADTGDPLKASTDALTAALNKLIDLLSKDLPNAAASGAQRITNSLAGIPTSIDIGVNYDINQPQQNAAGALISSPTLSWIAEAGQPEIVGPVDFMTEALRGAIGNLSGPASLAGPSGGGDIIVNVTVQGSVMTERDLALAVHDQLVNDLPLQLTYQVR
jgi:hypothetical protein